MEIFIYKLTYLIYKMRTKQKQKVILVSPEVHQRLIQDRNHFQKVIGGGKWSINDTLTEWIKILRQVEI